MRRCVLCFAIGSCLAIALVPTLARAKPQRIESRSSIIDVDLLARLSENREVALIESNPDGTSKQVVLFSVLEGTPDRVFSVLDDVDAYPSFLETIAKAKVVTRAAGALVYDWELSVPVIPNLGGRRMQRGKRPHVIEVRGVSGDLRDARERWEFYGLPGGTRTLAAFYRALDIETAGLVLRAFVALDASMEQAINLATAFMHMRDLSRHVARRTKPAAVPKIGAVPRFSRLPLGARELANPKMKRLLDLGPLAFIDSHADESLAQVALLTLVDAPRAKLEATIEAPEKYPEFLPSFAKQRARFLAPNRIEMTWELDVPLVNLTGVSMMNIEEDGSIDIEAVSGDLRRGRWRWEFDATTPTSTVLVHYAYSDVREASWVTRVLVEKQPLFEHGIVAASGVVAAQGMKARAEGRR